MKTNKIIDKVNAVICSFQPITDRKIYQTQ